MIKIVVLHHLIICKSYVCCVLLHDRTKSLINTSIDYSFVNTLPIYCSNYSCSTPHSAKCYDSDLDLDLLLDEKDSFDDVLNVEDKFHGVNKKIVDKSYHSTSEVSKKEKLRWASFEVRRLTYKLGTINKKVRKAKAEWDMMYNTFAVDKTELSAISKKKGDLCTKLEHFRGLRNRFIRYIKGLKCNSDPPVPFVPSKYRSTKVPAYFYSAGAFNISKHKGRNKNDPMDKGPIAENDSKYLKNKLMRIVADVKGKAVYKDKLVNKSVIKYRGF